MSITVIKNLSNNKVVNLPDLATPLCFLKMFHITLIPTPCQKFTFCINAPCVISILSFTLSPSRVRTHTGRKHSNLVESIKGGDDPEASRSRGEASRRARTPVHGRRHEIGTPRVENVTGVGLLSSGRTRLDWRACWEAGLPSRASTVPYGTLFHFGLGTIGHLLGWRASLAPREENHPWGVRRHPLHLPNSVT